jgi:hypothetical protein
LWIFSCGFICQKGVVIVGARRLLCSFVVVVGMLVFASAPALATGLEAPQLTVESIAASSATLRAVLNPVTAGGAGTYEFLYKQGKAGCTGGTKVPMPAGLMTGTAHEEVAEGISGLLADSEYTACARVVNTTSSPSEEATSVAVTFTTAIPPETPTVVSPVKSVTATSATLEGVLNPHAAGNPGSYEFLYRVSASECEGSEVSVSGGSALGHKEEVVKAQVVLAPDTTYTVCLRAYNNAGEASATSAPVTFTTSLTAPVVEGESSANVAVGEARLEAAIDPENAATAYHFEYGPAAGSYDASTPVVEIPAGLLQSVSVNTVLTGLAPSTTYHYRVVASNALPAVVDGSDEMFMTSATQPTGTSTSCANEQLRAEQPYASRLPDCRAYEMVSPVETLGNDAVDSFTQTAARASLSGEAVTYASEGVFANPRGQATQNQYISRRGPGGWSTQAITPLHDPVQGETNSSYETVDFTPELTEGIANTNASLTSESAGPGEREYLANFVNGSYRLLGGGVNVEGSSTDLSHVLLEEGSEWVDGSVEHVTVANNGESIASGVAKGWHAVSTNGSRVYMENAHGQLYLRENAEQAQSPMNGEVCTDASDACTIDVSASQKTDGNGPKGIDLNEGSANFWGASASGAKAFFTSNQELTNDANTGVSDKQEIVLENPSGGTYTLTFKGQTTVPIAYNATPEEVQSALEALSSISAGNVAVSAAGSGYLVTFDGALATSEQPAMSADGSSLAAGGTVAVRVLARPGSDLYEYDLETGKLKDLTVDDTDNHGAAVLGVVEVSEEGSYVYYVADGALAGNAVSGRPNLYVSHEGSAPSFIATLAARDQSDWNSTNSSEGNTAAVPPSGSRLAFISEESLTGYNNEQAESGECQGETGKCQEIYLYNAGAGGLACASCDPSGARPVGPSSFGPVGGHQGPGLYRARNLIEGGTLFFDSADELVSHASDGRQNVYEYEGGHVYPISDVAGGFESFLLDASPDGDNVFFGSADQLLPQDVSNNVVVYDARVDGGFPVSVVPPPCDNGDACKPPPAPQPAVFGAPGSATFAGPGNIEPVPVKPVVKAKAKTVKCKKGYEKKKGKCVKTRKPKKKRAGKSSDRRGSK